jgi:hypothetical protein
VIAGDAPVLVHNCNLAEKFGVPRKPGVYVIELNDGNFYIGSSYKPDMYGRVKSAGTPKSGKKKHALEDAEYTADDVKNVTWMEVPGRYAGGYASSYETRRLEQIMMDLHLEAGYTIVNRKYAEWPAPWHTDEWFTRFADQVPNSKNKKFGRG